MARECQSCSKCQNPLSDFEKMIGEVLGADKVDCVSCTKKYGGVSGSTCPRCGREGLESMGEGSFMRTRCIYCGYDDITGGS